MNTRITLLVAGLVPRLGLGAGPRSDAATAAPSQKTYIPAPHTIVEVTGDKVHGFGVYYYDGSSIFPPTDSEARAECTEYDEQPDRLRCRVETRVWYRDLGHLKRAINYAQDQAADRGARAGDQARCLSLVTLARSASMDGLDRAGATWRRGRTSLRARLERLDAKRWHVRPVRGRRRGVLADRR